ncbi:MAG: hypothetical protein DRO10_03625 [Thermoprotei archaeon]|nr:MAG: hypothetical protein DRO10_03625 [Thermoprotei archaeon]
MKWPPGKRKRDLLLLTDTADLLKAVKKVYTYDELTEYLGLQPSTLSRYVQGEILPAPQRAREILAKLAEPAFMRRYVTKVFEKYSFSIHKAFSDPDFLTAVSIYFAREFLARLAGTRVIYVLTFPDTSSIIAAIVSRSVGLSPVIIGRNARSGETIQAIEKGSMSVMVASILGSEELTAAKEAMRMRNLRIPLVETVILQDPSKVVEMFGKERIIHLFP